MKEKKNAVITVHERPRNQCELLMQWFKNIGVDFFDLNVRRYPTTEAEAKEKWITCHERVTVDRVFSFWSWMRRENARGADIYFRPHGTMPQPVLFLDDLNLQTSLRVAKAYSSAVIQTSKGNTQVWVQTNRPLSLEERKDAQAHLVTRGFGDKGSTSGDHLGRICGFFSQKRQSWVNLKYFSTPRAYDPPQLEEITSPHQGGGACVSSSSTGGSPSEDEFGWAVGMLKAGKSPADIQILLENRARRRGKRNPEKYASLTVTKAIAMSE
jgi:hypothetical protein